MKLPLPDPAILKQRHALITALHNIVPDDCIVQDDEGLRVFESDGLTANCLL
ncbi:MAG: hypothetical protein V6Z81_02685 [Parvularculales bacterium]